MLAVTLSADEIETAPPGVRQWVEQQVACIFGWPPASEPAEQIAALLPPDCNVEKANGEAGGGPFAVEKGLATQGMARHGPAHDSTRAEALRQQIAERAYQLWESQGRPYGRDLINWHQAEHEIMSCMGDGESPAPSEEVAQGGAGSEPVP